MWFVHKPCEMMAQADRSHEFIFKRTWLGATRSGFCFPPSPRGSRRFCPGWSGPAGTTGLPPKEPHLDSCICAWSHLCSPFLGQRGQFWPHSCAQGFDVMGMSRKGGQAARFGQELLSLTTYTLLQCEPSPAYNCLPLTWIKTSAGSWMHICSNKIQSALFWFKKKKKFLKKKKRFPAKAGVRPMLCLST